MEIAPLETVLPDKLYSLSSLLQPLRQEEERSREARRSGIAPGPVTGFPELDKLVGGFLAPGLHTLISAPGAGKTALALQIAGQCGCPCLYVTSEMRPIELFRRIIARTTKTFLGKLRGGHLEDDDIDRLGLCAANACPMVTIYDASDGETNAAAIQEMALSLKDRYEAAHVLIVLDSLTDWVNSGIFGNMDEYTATETGLTALHRVTVQLGCPALLIVHRNRAGQRSTADESSKLHAGKATGRIEYICESLWNLEKKAIEPDLNGYIPEELFLLKNRHGITGRKQSYRFEGRIMQFEEV